MEGELFKWTNYFSGWQPRWFHLAGGILSYYDSREEAWKGCKGSIQMAVCEIQVHPTDSTRMDLTIPGPQHFYLRAQNSADRQKWLVALGSAKACLADIRTKKETEFSDHVKALKAKMSELRLRCDLLIQQLNKAKASSIAQDANAEPQEVIDAAVLLRSTSDAFLKTLEDCMQLSHSAFNLEASQAASPESHLPNVYKPNKVKPPTLPNHVKMERQAELNDNCEHGPVNPDSICRQVTVITNETSLHIASSPTGNNLPLHESQNVIMTGGDALDMACKPRATDDHVLEGSPQLETGFLNKPSTWSCSEEEKEGEQKKDGLGGTDDVKTFFSVMSQRFNDIVLLEDDGIPTQLFLDSCYAIVPVLDKLGPTVFAPVKMDFVGNIKKINQKFITQKERFHTLQSIVLHEVDNNVAGVRNSATDALLWLKRGLKFLKEFLSEVKNGERNINTALSFLISVEASTWLCMFVVTITSSGTAYGKTLRQYHGWVVRGVFALALRAAPTYDSLAAALAVSDQDDWKETFAHAMRRDLNLYLPAMEKQLNLLDALYEEHNLESDEVV